MNYHLGLKGLKRNLPKEVQKQFTALERRLILNIQSPLSDGQKQADERRAIVAELNKFALQFLDIDFEALCDGKKPDQRTKLKKEIDWLIGKMSDPAGEPTLAVRNPSVARGNADSKLAIHPRSIQKYWALVIGVERYHRDFDDLKYAVDDAVAMEQLLREHDYFVVMLNDDQDEEKQPNRSNVLAALKTICSNVERDDLLLVYFAGHGKSLNGNPYLIVQDTRIAALEDTAVSVSKVKSIMNKSPAERKILIIDACQSGPGRSATIVDEEFTKNVYELASGFATIAACTSEQIAHEMDDKKHGAFTYYLLEALRGNADRDNNEYITVDEVEKHTLSKLRELYTDKIMGEFQDPSQDVKGIGYMIIVDFRRRKEK